MEGYFDVVILGTGLTESILAAAISKAGFTVAHIDVNPYYGAHEASLSLDELAKWADDQQASPSDADTFQTFHVASRTKYASVSRSQSVPSQPRQYSVSLSPAVIPSAGSLISSLISSGVARYGGYKLLDRVAIYDAGRAKPVPGNKEDVFKDKSISLIEKRRLMRFLLFAAGDFEQSKELQGKEELAFSQFLRTTFSLNEEMTKTIVFALAYCLSASDPTLTALRRIRKYLKSAGRYGSSSFLVAHYGGLGEIAQGFCRTSAVSGGVHILGRKISSITRQSQHSSADSTGLLPQYAVQLEDFPKPIYGEYLISSSDYVAEDLQPLATYVTPDNDFGISYRTLARCIMIVDRPIPLEAPPSSMPEDYGSPENPLVEESRTASDKSVEQVDSSMLIFPPGSLPNGSNLTSVHVHSTGPGAMSTPAGKWIVHFSMALPVSVDSSTESLLRPYVDAVLVLIASCTTENTPYDPLFITYYTQEIADPSSLLPSLSPPDDSNPPTFLVTPPLPSHITEAADAAALNAETMFWKAMQGLRLLRQRKAGPDTSADPSLEVESFWPLVENSDDEEEEEW